MAGCPISDWAVSEQFLNGTSAQLGHSRRYTLENTRQKINQNKKAVLPQGNRAMPQVFFSVEVGQQHSLQA